MSKRSLWPISILVFFAVAITAAVTFVAYCNLHPTDLVAADYYEQEVHHQQRMESTQRTQRLPEAASVSVDAAGRFIRVALPAAHSGPGLAGTIHLYRPANAALDQHLKLATDNLGLQEIDSRGLEPGLWRVKVEWNAGGEDYVLDQKVVVSGKGP